MFGHRLPPRRPAAGSAWTASLLLGLVGTAVGQSPPTGYYASAEGKAGAALKAALHDIIDDHTVVAYSWPPFLDIDEAPSNGDHVDLIYSDGTRSKTRNGGAVGDWNREHLWPRSYGIFNDDGADNSDLFNLRPSDVQVNSERGSLFFDNTEPGGEVALQFDAPGCSKDGDSWEPRDDEKGDVARACFYMDVRYDGSDFSTNDLELSDAPDRTNSRFGSLLTLLRWHRLDPPDDAERSRNAAVYSRWQGNRNPFIDRPDFAEKVYLARYPELDDDGDGLPDWWEFRTLGGLGPTPSSDADGDGASALAEYVFASDPADPSDRPELTVSRSDTLMLTFIARARALEAGYTVGVQSSETLGPETWLESPVLDLRSSPAGDGLDRFSITLPAPQPGPARFYRLEVEAL